MTFQDHFSTQAADYAQHRPTYPAELYAYLASVAPAQQHVLDVATGNGQAAHGLAAHFAHVTATDASAAQIAQAVPHPRIRYAVAPAERSGCPPGTVDLVTVAQALHWFDTDAFYDEVLRPGGILAAWTYSFLRINPALDALLDAYYREVVGPFWPPERAHVEAGYTTLTFPLDELPAPTFRMTRTWQLADLLGYLRTWSARKRYREAHGTDPILQVAPQLTAAWGEATTPRTVHWTLPLRLGRAEG